MKRIAILLGFFVVPVTLIGQSSPPPPPPPVVKTTPTPKTEAPFKIGDRDTGLVKPPPPAALSPQSDSSREGTGNTAISGPVSEVGFGAGAAITYREPNPGSLKPYVSEPLGFETILPGLVRKQELFILNGRETLHLSNHGGGGYQVSVSEFAFNLKDVHTEDEIFGYVKDRIAQDGNYLIKGERNFESGKVSGIELDLESNQVRRKLRAFFSGRKIFEVSLSVPLGYFRNVVRSKNDLAFESESNRFLNSFALTKKDRKAGSAIVVNLNPTKTDRLPKLVLPDDEFDAKKGRFVSRSGAFEIDVREKPGRMFSLIQDEAGATELTQYSLINESEVVTFGYFDFPSELPTRADKRFQADYQRDFLIGRTPSASLVSEKDLEFKGHFGREYEVKIDKLNAVLRFIFVKQRVFKIFFADANGGPSDGANARKFFGSLSFGEMPEPEFRIPLLPDDFGTDYTEKSASSTHLGFSIEFEKDWGVVDYDFLQTILTSARDEGKSFEGIKREEHFELLDNTRFLFMIARFEPEEANPPSISIIAERAGFPNFLPKDAVNIYRAQTEPGETLTGNEGFESFDGVEFAWYESHTPADQSYTRFYIANRFGLRLVFSVVFSDEAALKQQLGILNTLRFSNGTFNPTESN